MNSLPTDDEITIERCELLSQTASEVIAALNAELIANYPEPDAALNLRSLIDLGQMDNQSPACAFSNSRA